MNSLYHKSLSKLNASMHFEVKARLFNLELFHNQIALYFENEFQEIVILVLPAFLNRLYKY